MYFPDITSEYQVAPGDQEEAWTEAIKTTFEKFAVTCPLHVYENGFCQGDASDEELTSCMLTLGVQDEASMYGKLNGCLEEEYRRRLEEASKILILPEPPVDPERAEFVRLCLGGPDVDLGPCPVCGDPDCRKDHLEED